MKKNKTFFMTSMPVITAVCSLFAFCDNANAAARAPSTAPRKTAISAAVNTSKASEVATSNTSTTNTAKKSKDTNNDTESSVVLNKSAQFSSIVSDVIESASPDNSFAEQIRNQRAAFAASEATDSIAKKISSGSNSCDADLRKCMGSKCGKDFTNCALDGDTIFGDKLNACRNDTKCTSEEFTAFTREIKADRDMNARLSSYNSVINCGNQYNACIVNECGTTYNKCLGKAYADAAVEKCSIIAKECTESDSSLAARFGTAIAKLRESAEIEVKQDEEQLYKLRDMMKSTCNGLGAMFDERSFDCVYTVNFFTGAISDTPTASRKRYAGDTFVCMQEWFGVNATTFKENAYRETRAQTAASSAMLGSGLGTAVGTLTSGALDRALDTQDAKEDYKEECESQDGKIFAGGECRDMTKDEKEKAERKQLKKNNPDEYKKLKKEEREQKKTNRQAGKK